MNETGNIRRVATISPALKFFISMLGGLGGSYSPDLAEPRDYSKPLDGRRAAARHARPLNKDSYVERHSTIYHRKMKRPPNMSARQWKKFYKAMRRAGKSQAAA